MLCLANYNLIFLCFLLLASTAWSSDITLSEDLANFSEAKSGCEADGSSLAVIFDYEVQHQLMRAISKKYRESIF